MKHVLTLLLALLPTLGWAAEADVHILGEVHDNPAHHLEQARRISEIAPRAVVFEMLTQAQAARVTPELLGNPKRLAMVLDWANSGWPDFELYAPVFAASRGAKIIGAAVPREVARQVMQDGLVNVFGPDAALYNLTQPLPDAQQTAREALQMEAHCDALPEAMLPMMVEIQRLRDAMLAKRVVEAMDDTGPPVVVITGNGHARRDWGVPAVLAQAAPELELFVLGQYETGRPPPEGGFDALLPAPPVDRGDPCDAFR